MNKMIKGYGSVSQADVANMNAVDLAELEVFVNKEEREKVDKIRAWQIDVLTNVEAFTTIFFSKRGNMVDMVIVDLRKQTNVYLNNMSIDDLISKANRLNAKIMCTTHQVLERVRVGFFGENYGGYYVR